MIGLSDRLEKFQAPRSPWDLFPGAVMALIALAACNMDFDSALTDEKIIAESKQAVAAERTPSVRLPLAHPLGCPEEDERGRALQATISIKGEKRPRCYYGKM